MKAHVNIKVSKYTGKSNCKQYSMYPMKPHCKHSVIDNFTVIVEKYSHCENESISYLWEKELGRLFISRNISPNILSILEKLNISENLIILADQFLICWTITINTDIPGDVEKILFTSLRGRLFAGGDYLSRGYYSSKYGM